MLLSELAKKWGSGLWKLFRPTELLRGLVDSFRVATNRLTVVPDISEPGKMPVPRGAAYAVLAVPLKNIGHNVTVLGRDGVDPNKFPYTITGIPGGIIYFCRSLESVGGSLYYDFIEDRGVYYFTDNPSKYGVINTRGEGSCSFIVFNSESRSLGLQDTLGKYCDSSDVYTNRIINDYDATAGISNGISHHIVEAAAGTVTSTAAITKNWIEGGVEFSTTEARELIRRDAAVNAYAGVVYSDATGVFHYSSEPDVVSEYKDRGIVSIDTTAGPSQPGAQRALDMRINPVSTRILYQRVPIAPPEGCTGIHVYFDDISGTSSMPAVCAGMTARHAVLDNAGEFGILRLGLDSTSGTAVSFNGVEYGQSLGCGKYIKALSYVALGKSLATDVILSHIQVSPILINAGGCVVFTPN